MIRKIHEALEQREEGFTLIELLVVVIIIGILAAIAIPTFLNQREKAWESAAKSDLRNAASAQEAYYVDASEYADTATGGAGAADDLEDYGFNKGSNITFTIVSANATAYCMKAVHTSGGDAFYFSSANGEPLTTACS